MTQVSIWPAEKCDVGAAIEPSPWASSLLDILGKTSVIIYGSEVPVKLAKATPQMFKVGTLFDDRLRLREPLTVGIGQEGNVYIAKCEKFEEFGYGDDPLGAVDDLRQALAELYWTLKKEQRRLGSALVELWTALQETIEER